MSVGGKAYQTIDFSIAIAALQSTGILMNLIWNPVVLVKQISDPG
jgi:hypothetical protein